MYIPNIGEYPSDQIDPKEFNEFVKLLEEAGYIFHSEVAGLYIFSLGYFRIVVDNISGHIHLFE